MPRFGRHWPGGHEPGGGRVAVAASGPLEVLDAVFAASVLALVTLVTTRTAIASHQVLIVVSRLVVSGIAATST